MSSEVGVSVNSSSCPLSSLTSSLFSSSSGFGVGSDSPAVVVGVGSWSDPESVGSTIEGGDGSIVRVF